MFMVGPFGMARYNVPLLLHSSVTPLQAIPLINLGSGLIEWQHIEICLRQVITRH